MDTGIDMVAPPPAEEEALQKNDQGFEEQDFDQGFGQHFLITDTSGSLIAHYIQLLHQGTAWHD